MKVLTVLLLSVFLLSPVFAQSQRETNRREQILLKWAIDGVVPITKDNADGSQSLAVLASSWYFPLSYTAKAGKPSVLRIYTHKTFDCSRAFSIPSMGVQKLLSPSGVFEVAIPAMKAGATLFGTCSMGMYTFTIQFL